MLKVKSFLQLSRQVGNVLIDWHDEMIFGIDFFREFCLGFYDALLHPRRVKWASFRYYMDIGGGCAMPIIALLGFLVGVILSYQILEQLGRYGVQNYVVKLVGTVMVSELAPLMTAVVVAGRSGSAFAAEIGAMKGSEELDAIVTMGILPHRYLVVPKVLALLLVMPGLTFIADFCGVLGGMVVVCINLDFSMTEYFSKTAEAIQLSDLLQGVIKSVIFGGIVAIVGCMKGFEATRDAKGVGIAATSATVSAIFLIIVSDALLTVLFNF